MAWLDHLFTRYHHAEFIHPDPLEFPHRYESVEDREIVAFISSVLAYGNVKAIIRSVEGVLSSMTAAPCEFLARSTPAKLRRRFKGFRYRFTSEHDLVSLLTGLARMVNEFGSIEACVAAGVRDDDRTVINGMSHFVDTLRRLGRHQFDHLVPHPDRGSACKRMNLFLRWMVRRDVIDPGGWTQIPRSMLIVPVDTHMHQIALKLDWTQRKQANLKTALEITDVLRSACPSDPTKYDFSLTRPGIRNEPMPGVGSS